MLELVGYKRACVEVLRIFCEDEDQTIGKGSGKGDYADSVLLGERKLDSAVIRHTGRPYNSLKHGNAPLSTSYGLR